MQKIRKEYIKEIYEKDLSIKNEELNRLMKVMDIVSCGKSYNKINYLTFDELQYLMKDLSKDNSNYQEICNKYIKSKNLLSRFSKCIENKDLSSLSIEEKEKIQILLGYVTEEDLFLSFVNYNEEKFEFTSKELIIKKKLEDSITLDTILKRDKEPTTKIAKYKAMYYSKYIHDICENEENINPKTIKSLKFDYTSPYDFQEEIQSYNINQIAKLCQSKLDPAKKYILEKILIDRSKENQMINKLIEQKRINELGLFNMAYYYICGDGEPFQLGQKHEIISIKKKNREKLLAEILKDKENMITIVQDYCLRLKK